MASDDKTYCGRTGKEGINIGPNDIKDLAIRLGVSEQDILDVIEKLGPDLQVVEDYFFQKQNSY